MITDISKLPRRPFESVNDALVRCHHEAFMVQTLGAAAAGITPEEFAALQECGLVPQDVRYLDRPALADNTFLIATTAAVERVRATNEIQLQMLDWTKEKWLAKLYNSDAVVGYVEARIPEPKSAQIVIQHKTDIAVPSHVVENKGLTMREQIAFSRVTRDAGDFIRGLGNEISQEIQRAEVWQGEKLIDSPDAAKRAERLQSIQGLLQQGITERWSPQKTASMMANTVGDYTRNWRRIAQTELQALFNDATVLEGIHYLGNNIKIARIPETTACHYCLDLFLDENGVPRLFTPQEMVANRTNIGVPRAEWKPTLYPLHPLCRCGVQVVMPGQVATRYGRLTDAPAT